MNKFIEITLSIFPVLLAPLIFLACNDGSRVAKLTNFHATADGVLPIASAKEITIGWRALILLNGILQYKLNATINSSRVQFRLTMCINLSYIAIIKKALAVSASAFYFIRLFQYY